MPVITSPQQFTVEDVFIDLLPAFDRSLFLKCEGFNFAGSIKLKAAAAMVDAAEATGRLRPGCTLVESSSGNLGLALSLIAASRGYGFICVTDSRCNPSVRQAMQVLGSRVLVVTEPDPDGGLLGARIRLVRELCTDDRYVWLNQYANRGNWVVHYEVTAPAVEKQFPELDVLFVGAGTTGTLMGCARYFKERSKPVTVVAIDAAGSVSFGGTMGTRHIPGLGASIRPPLLDENYLDDVVHVAEPDAIRACHRLLHRGFLFGGSTGTVVAGALSWLRRYDAGEKLLAVAIAPDLGERYLSSIYQPSWIREHFGADLVDELFGAADGGRR